MLCGQFVAAFCQNAYKINIINGGDIVFLYESGNGIIAYGRATGIVNKKDRVMPENGQLVLDGCHYQKLSDFHILQKPFTASDIKNLLERNVSFNNVMFNIGNEDGPKILSALTPTNN